MMYSLQRFTQTLPPGIFPVLPIRPVHLRPRLVNRTCFGSNEQDVAVKDHVYYDDPFFIKVILEYKHINVKGYI